MKVDIDPHSPVPPFEQLREQISSLAATGALRVGARLPSIRQLAGDLGLATGTVARAYRELEADGVVASRVRHGTTVLPRADLTVAERRARLDAAAQAFVRTARTLGATPEQARDAVRRNQESHPPEPGEPAAD